MTLVFPAGPLVGFSLIMLAICQGMELDLKSRLDWFTLQAFPRSPIIALQIAIPSPHEEALWLAPAIQVLGAATIGAC